MNRDEIALKVLPCIFNRICSHADKSAYPDTTQVIVEKSVAFSLYFADEFLRQLNG